MTFAAWVDDKNRLEGIRQGDVKRAVSTFTGSTVQTAIDSAERAFNAQVVASGVTNGVDVTSIEPYRSNCLNRPRPSEKITATDTTPFSLWGGRYSVAATATWGGGTVTLQDGAGNVYATFTANGSATIDVRYGTDYALTIATATGVSVIVKPVLYSTVSGV